MQKGIEYYPACGKSLVIGEEDFVAKLIASMGHPGPTRAALAIQMLSEMLGEARAIEPLMAH